MSTRRGVQHDSVRDFIAPQPGRIVDGVRLVLSQVIRQSDRGARRWVVPIHEIARPVLYAGHRLESASGQRSDRKVFEHLFQDAGGRFCPLFWQKKLARTHPRQLLNECVWKRLGGQLAPDRRTSVELCRPEIPR